MVESPGESGDAEAADASIGLLETDDAAVVGRAADGTPVSVPMESGVM